MDCDDARVDADSLQPVQHPPHGGGVLGEVLQACKRRGRLSDHATAARICQRRRRRDTPANNAIPRSPSDPGSGTSVPRLAPPSGSDASVAPKFVAIELKSSPFTTPSKL